MSLEKSVWQEFWSKEDWWAVWIGLGIVILAILFYLNGSSISWIAVAPVKWNNRNSRSGTRVLHLDQSDRKRYLDWHLGLCARIDCRHRMGAF